MMFSHSYLLANSLITSGSKAYKNTKSLLIFLVFPERFSIIENSGSRAAGAKELFHYLGNMRTVACLLEFT